mgnify:CR=1 FL=1
MMFETAKNIIKIEDIENYNIELTNIPERVKLCRKIKGLSQMQLANISGLDRSTINEIEMNHNHNIKLETLIKLMRVLDNEILLDEYCKFILNQKEVIKNLIYKFGKEYLCNILGVHRSTLERWGSGKYKVKRRVFEKIKCIT